jgi:hypothetical protein
VFWVNSGKQLAAINCRRNGEHAAFRVNSGKQLAAINCRRNCGQAAFWVNSGKQLAAINCRRERRTGSVPGELRKTTGSYKLQEGTGNR